MKYDRGLTLSENKQLNEWTEFKQGLKTAYNAGSAVLGPIGDGLEYLVDVTSEIVGDDVNDVLKKGSELLIKDIQQAYKTPDSLTTNNLLDYIGYRTTEMTEKELPQNFLEVIAHTLCYKSTNQKQCDPKKWRNKPQLLDYTDYQKASGGKADGGFWEGIVNSPEVYSDIQTALGSSTVQNGEGYWIVTDNYDFDNIRRIHQDGEDRKKVYDSLWNMPWDSLKSTWNIVTGPWNKENLAKYAERILAWQHSSGYKGFPIKLKIPKSGCKFCN